MHFDCLEQKDWIYIFFKGVNYVFNNISQPYYGLDQNVIQVGGNSTQYTWTFSSRKSNKHYLGVFKSKKSYTNNEKPWW